MTLCLCTLQQLMHLTALSDAVADPHPSDRLDISTQDNSRAQNDHDHGNGHGPEAAQADSHSDLRDRLNDRPRFGTFMMARTSSRFTEKPDTRMQPFRFADDQSHSAADERCLRGESIRELLAACLGNETAICRPKVNGNACCNCHALREVGTNAVGPLAGGVVSEEG